MTAEGRVTARMRSPARLLVVYDGECGFCIRCRQWLEHQPTYVELHFESAQSEEARRRFAAYVPWLGEELVVVSERGEVWAGPAAFLICLWATKDYREWSYRLSGQALAPLTERFFDAISSHRRTLARVAGGSHPCNDGRCRHRR